MTSSAGSADGRDRDLQGPIIGAIILFPAQEIFGDPSACYRGGLGAGLHGIFWA
jgi:hypothetical protein